MVKSSDSEVDTEMLRRQAEDQLKQQEPPLPKIEIDSQRLLHELQVHQIELEMQNAALKEAQEETLAALERETQIKAHLEEIVAARTGELLLAKKHAEAANIAKSAFLANMSHELRTPLNAIMGMTTLALRRATDTRQTDYLNKALQGAENLAAIIGDILDISKIEAEHLTLEKISFEWDAMLQNVMSVVRQKATEKGLALFVDLAPEISHGIFLGDPLRLGQILTNLMSNAVKFTERGSITVRVRQVEETSGNVLLRCEVQDTGIGISEEDQQRLFVAFEQADGSMTRKYGGTGLGLAISKRLVHLMGGEIGVESVQGQGSTFWFSVRVGKETGAEDLAGTPFPGDAEACLRAHYAGTWVLLAEDEPVNQEVATELLRGIGFKVDVAMDGREAVDLAHRHGYDLILMDMQMPNLNGLDATHAIRVIPELHHTPILAMTANAFGEDRQACLDAGMNDYISKPYDPVDFFEMLLKWLPRQRGSNPTQPGFSD